MDRVILIYDLEKNQKGYVGKEYRPHDIPQSGTKVIDITAVIVDNRDERKVSWFLYDMKDTLAGAETVLHLYDQWNSGLKNLQHGILAEMKDYAETGEVGVITRTYDKDKMVHLEEEYRILCDRMVNNRENMTLAGRKKVMDINKCRGVLKAAQTILSQTLYVMESNLTYAIGIRKMVRLDDVNIYEFRFQM
jgi:hypothetical protein